MRFSGLEIVRHVRERRDVRPAREADYYLKALRQVAGILRDLPWLVGGGLAVPLTLGGFYRDHGDVDIVVPLEKLGEAETAMRDAGYQMVRRFKMVWRHRGIDLLVTAHAESRLVRRCPRHLVLRDPACDQAAKSLISVMCIYAYRETDEYMETCDYGRQFPKTVPIAGARVQIGQGMEIRCLNLHYVAALKRLRSGERHRLDLNVIANADTPNDTHNCIGVHESIEGPSAVTKSMDVVTS